MKKLFFLILITVFCVNAQTVDTKFRATNSVYALEQDDETHIRLYQNLLLQSGIKEFYNLKFNFMGRALTDLEENIDDLKRFNAYRLSLSASDIFNMVDFEIGRQFLHPGAPLGGLDGLNMVIRPVKNLSVQVYGGVESHLQNSFQAYYTDEAFLAGGLISYRNLFNTTIQTLYLQKMREDDMQWQLAGLNLINKSLNDFTFILQSHYDMVNSRLHRLYFSTRYMPSNKMSFGLNVKQQYPQIYGDSYFKIFDVKEYRMLGLSGFYRLTDSYALTAQANVIQLSEGQGIRLIVAANNRNGSVGVSYETGDLGDEIGFVVDYGYDITEDLIASISVDYSRYRFEEIYDYESQLANAARITYSFSKQWRTDLEYQWLTNRFYDADQRILNHIHFIW